MRKLVGGLAGCAVGVAFVLANVGPVHATLEMQKQAKTAGAPATNCLYCHNEKLPKKEAITHNDRGKWLIAEKDKRKAKAVDGAWLKEYPADKK